MRTQRIDMRLGSALLALMLLAAGVVQAAESYRARLTMVPIEARTSAGITGSGSATAELDGTRLTISGSFAGLSSEATFGALHASPVTAVRGPKIAEFAVPQATSGSFAAELVLTPEQARSLRQGRLYIQIHSTGAPDGNLWGWLLE